MNMNLRAYAAEFIGTFALIFVGVGAIAADQISAGAVGWSDTAVGWTGIALAHGLTIGVMVSATAAVSGGHINPAVTIGAFSVGKINGVNTVGYVVAQCLGGIAAATLVKLSVPADVLSAVNMGTPALNTEAGVNAGMGIVTELILTFFLVFVVFGTVIDRRAPKVGGLFVGLTITMDILMGGPITGGAMNPARHLGPALLGGGMSETWIYWLGPVIGGVLAAQVYHHVLEKPEA